MASYFSYTPYTTSATDSQDLGMHDPAIWGYDGDIVGFSGCCLSALGLLRGFGGVRQPAKEHGGCAQGFGEIAFCAVTAIEQVKGFGTRLMNYTKARPTAADPSMRVPN